MSMPRALFFFFFFNDTATTEIYTLSLHDALPISQGRENALALACLRFQKGGACGARRRVACQRPGSGDLYRQIARSDDPALVQRTGVAQRISQFADVSRPAVGHEALEHAVSKDAILTVR